MKISLDWLSDVLELTEKDPLKIADQLTRRMGEVDDVLMQGQFLHHGVVGKILTVSKHPDADKLAVCTVQTEQGTKTVVCGGSNVRPDMLVAFAHIGATVKWHGGEVMTLRRVKIRGVESEGMICAQEELDLTSFPPKPEDGPRPIVDLSVFRFPFSTSPIGMPLREALGLTDAVLCIDNHAITNRPDLFSHIGVARELVAMELATWKKKSAPEKMSFPKTAIPFKRMNDIPALVPRLVACCLHLPTHTETPDWMKRRLEAVGSRSINLLVDITNYVMLETGMPLHSFDLADIKGTVRIRLSKKGEKITTLDGVERVLPDGAMVLSDDTGIFDLLGVMGGLRSSTKATSTEIYLHAAIVDPASIRKAVIATGHRTDAATIYEKGVPFVAAETGFARALQLILSLSPDAKISSMKESEGKEEVKKPVSFPTDDFKRSIGVEIKPKQIRSILEDLGCDVKETAKSVTVTAPLWRNDLTKKQDIIEEVARIYGYAHIPPVMPEACIVPPMREARIHALRDALSESGATEMLHLAFTSPEQCRKWKLPVDGAMKIENPIGEELSLMHMCLIPSLVETGARELKHMTGPYLKVFETGHTFSKHGEKNMFAMTILARGKTTLKDSPVLLAKTDMLRALKAAGYEATVRTAKPTAPYAHNGRSGEIVCKGQVIGSLFEIHPMITASLDLKGRAAAAILGLDALLALAPDVLITAPLPVFPAIELDETVPLTGKRSHGDVMAALKTIDPLLERIDVVDLYEKESLRTISLRFTYRAADRTLTQQEVEKTHAKVVVELRR